MHRVLQLFDIANSAIQLSQSEVKALTFVYPRKVSLFTAIKRMALIVLNTLWCIVNFVTSESLMLFNASTEVRCLPLLGAYLFTSTIYNVVNRFFNT